MVEESDIDANSDSDLEEDPAFPLPAVDSNDEVDLPAQFPSSSPPRGGSVIYTSFLVSNSFL